MLVEHLDMKRLWVAVVILSAACTRPNPRSCADGTCSDPAFPFCDTDGALEGEAKTCIAVACTPDEFVACRGDRAITCNAEGTDYDLTACERGCDAAAGGCRLCDPNETACTNGKVATCDANGSIVSSETCALGCFENEPRCREIAPSNNLSQYLDMVATPPDLQLSNAVFRTDSGTVTVGMQVVDIPSFLVPRSGNGSAIRVYVVNSLKLTSATIYADGDSRDLSGAAMAIVARRDLTVNGEIYVDVRAGGAYLGCLPAGDGLAFHDSQSRVVSTGGGGGGNGTSGAAGGAIGTSPGGVGDTTSGTAALVPLRGGCSGGFDAIQPPGTYPNGGGALQLSSGSKLQVDATINIKGADGVYYEFEPNTAYFLGGGGAGGSLVLEAPAVLLSADTKLLASGGKGFQACDPPTMYCSAAGLGATATMAAQSGTSITSIAGPGPFQSGGGGGGLGRIRINTIDGSYTKANTTDEQAVVSTGTLETR